MAPLPSQTTTINPNENLQLGLAEKSGARHYDIHLLATVGHVDLSKDANLVRHVFAAKDVPLSLLARVGDYREFHRPDWPAVVASVDQSLAEFDFYFDFVLREIAKLEALWIE